MEEAEAKRMRGEFWKPRNQVFQKEGSAGQRNVAVWSGRKGAYSW